ncbi:DUF6252 family protein [Sediminibacterium salmoneum]|uniref:DUF6252 family protein n=1 Tax=Sediminibacterium salmoneum TaxID=426421 RepID=UPI00047C0C7D|nr:DUF6252 family protein [Sediminibacterium salmoneum]
MKYNYLKACLISFGFFIFLGACTKSNSGTSNNINAETSPFSAKIDNQAFPKAALEYTMVKYISSTKMLQVVGQPADRKETIILTLMPFSGKVLTAADWKPGTYDFDPVHVSNKEYLASAEYNKWNGNGYDQWFTSWDHVKNGKIIIESNTGTKIKGSFYFDAVLKKSDGTFNATSIRKITDGVFELDIK